MIDQLAFNSDGLIPAVVQDASSRRVLMVGYMNREALSLTLSDRFVTFWSRSRGCLWRKGETSGNHLCLVSIHPDCDRDTLLVLVHPEGAVCHTGAWSCFGEDDPHQTGTLERLEALVKERSRELPELSYTAELFRSGTARIAQKVGEESVETVIAAIQDNRNAIQEESADLLFHLLVLLVDREIPLRDVLDVLERRGARRQGPAHE